LAKDKFEDEKAKTEKEIQLKKEYMEKELTGREKAVAELLTFQDNWRNPIKRFRISSLSPLRGHQTLNHLQVSNNCLQNRPGGSPRRNI
jgi:hypothetical protein